MKRAIALCLVLIATVLLAMPVMAQNDEDEETLAYISDALARVNEQDSYHIAGTMSINQEMRLDGMTVPITMDYVIGGDVAFDDGELDVFMITMELTMSADAGFGKQTGSVTLEMRAIDDVLYIRTYDTGGILAGELDDNWFIAGDPDNSNEFAQEFNNPEELLSFINEQSTYTLTPETVPSLEAIEDVPEELEGLDGWIVGLDVLELYKTGEIEVVPGSIDAAALGMSEEDFLTQLYNGTTMELVVYIDPEENLVLHMKSIGASEFELESMGTTVEVSQTIDISFDYSEFNKPVEVEVPEV